MSLYGGSFIGFIDSFTHSHMHPLSACCIPRTILGTTEKYNCNSSKQFLKSHRRKHKPPGLKVKWTVHGS
jgi:hypothetical protein